MKYDVFISYSRDDIEIAKSVCAVLDGYKKHYTFEYFFDTSEIKSRDEYLKRIARAISESKTVLFLAGQNSYASEFCAKELLFADKRGVHIHQYRIDAAEMPLDLDMLLGNHQYREMKSTPIDSFVREVLADALGSEILPLEELEERRRLENLERQERQVAYEQELRDSIKIIEERRSEIKNEILSHKRAIEVLEQEDVDSKKKIAELYSKLGIQQDFNDEEERDEGHQHRDDCEPDDIGKVDLFDKIGRWMAKHIEWVASFFLFILFILCGSIVVVVSYNLWAKEKQAKPPVETTEVPLTEETITEETTELPLTEEIAEVETYSVGDYYDDGKRQGVVFDVWDNGKHGKIVSLDETKEQWCTYNQSVKRIANGASSQSYGKGIVIGASSKSDGKANTDKVMARADSSQYPAFQWCRAKGAEWYLPSKEELKLLYQVCNKVNKTLRDKSMKELTGWYWSSTEEKSIFAYPIYMNAGSTGSSNKIDIYYVRAVSAF